jgi:predicted ribosome quality control (RQC) complex YloA/Tae2 family protein
MKQRFNALDLKVALFELRKSFTSCRVTNVYDVDHKTYLIKLAKPDSKAVILIESGIRIHSTEFEMPKNIIPSGFSMKLRKHIRSRRLEKVNQVGADRIVDMQFGSNEAAYHLIIELYDRGNILLTDFEYTIISVLRPRTDADSDVKFTVREKYPLHLAKQDEKITFDKLNETFLTAKPNDDVKRLLTQNLVFGASLVEHCMSLANLPDKCIIGKSFDISKDLNKLYDALLEGEKLMDLITTTSCEGIIVQKMTKAPKLDSGSMMIGEEEVLVYDDFIPYLFKKFEKSPHLKFENFDRACDEFYSKFETQKIEMKESQQNREAIKKLENVKKDHQKRLEELKATQSIDEFKAKLIEYNLELVDQSIFLVNTALANQLNWNEIKEIIDEAKEDNHVIAIAIKQLKLDINHVVLELNDPEDEDNFEKKYDVEIDLGNYNY